MSLPVALTMVGGLAAAGSTLALAAGFLRRSVPAFATALGLSCLMLVAFTAAALTRPEGFGSTDWGWVVFGVLVVGFDAAVLWLAARDREARREATYHHQGWEER